MFTRIINDWRARRENKIRLPLGACHLKIRGSGNEIEVAHDIPCAGLRGVHLRIRGNQNRISIGSMVDIRGELRICIDGDNNEVQIGNSVIVVKSLTLLMSKGCRNGRIRIGDKTSFWRTEVRNYDCASEVLIGDDCMFSYDTTVINTDEHAILRDGQVINRAQQIEIGDHVWVGWGACIMKNSYIAEGAIIGRSSVVSGKFSAPRVVLAGVPARVVKEDIDWSRKDVNELIIESQEAFT